MYSILCDLYSVVYYPACEMILLCVLVCLIPWQIWANYEEKPTEEVAALQSEERERVAKYRAVYVTEITDELHFYTQDVETGTFY